MKRIFKVHKAAKTIRLTKDLVADGFDGELQGYTSACALILLKPGTDLEAAVEALETTIRDLQLRDKLTQHSTGMEVKRA